MQVVVKKPHIRIEGEVTGALVKYLRKEFGEIEVIQNEEEELVEITQSDWYRSLRQTIAPGENLRIYRAVHGMTQTELAEKLGSLTRQNISNMENGQRSISKAMAKRLAKLFEVSVEKFI